MQSEGKRVEGGDAKNQQESEALEAAPEAPKLPPGYVALSEPRPLIGNHDERWVVLGDHDGTGILIYEERRRVALLVSEECITMLYTLMEHTQQFLDLCNAEYLENPTHQSGLATVRSWLRWRTEHQAVQS